MTTVTGTLIHPITGDPAEGYVTFHLVNDRGERVENAVFEGESIVDGGDPILLVAGAYSTTALPPNADIESEEDATYWARTHVRSKILLNVPATGTWTEPEITHIPTMIAAGPSATNLITSASITTAVTGLSVNVFQFADVEPGTTVTVPDLETSVRIEGVAPIVCPATAGIHVGGFITRVSDTSNRGADYHYAGTANLPVTARPVAVIPPHSADDYKLRVYSFSTVTLTVDAQEGQPAGLWVYAI